MVSVRQRGACTKHGPPCLKWQARAYLGHDPLTGDKITPSTTIHAPDERTADRKAGRWEDELIEGERTHGQGGAFRQLLKEWVAVNERRWSPTTRRETLSIINRYLGGLEKPGGDDRHQLADVDVAKIRTHTLDVFYAQLEERGGRCQHRPCKRQPCAKHGPRCRKKACKPPPCPEHRGRCSEWEPCDRGPCKHGGPLSPATVQRTHVVVRAALRQAVAWEWIAKSPAEHVKLTEVDEEEVKPPTVADVVALLAAIEAVDPRLAVFVLVSAVTGARRGAVLALRWSDLDLVSGAIAFPRVVVDGPDGIEIIKATRRKRTGSGALDAYTVAALVAHRARMVEQAMACGAALTDDSLVFSDDPSGRVPWRPDATSKRYRRIRDGIGLADVLLRNIRHFFATALLAAGINPKTIAKIGGWRRVQTMLDRYAHSDAASDREAADTIGGMIAAEAG